MTLWRLQSSRYPLINSEGAKLTGGRWNQPGTAVIYILNPAHPDFARIVFKFAPVNVDSRLRPRD